jgi:hypothetical protein
MNLSEEWRPPEHNRQPNNALGKGAPLGVVDIRDD